MANNIHEIQKNKTNQSIAGRGFVIFIFAVIAILYGLAPLYVSSYEKNWKVLLSMFFTLAFSSITGFFLSKWLFYKDSQDSKEREDARKYMYVFMIGLSVSLLCFFYSCNYIREVNMY